jgi:glycosyltransferase domain-containing protein
MITLLIPTINRSYFLIRLLTYYRELGFQGCICIGDSSDPQHVERTKGVIQQLKGKMDIVYREYPGLSSAECIKNLVDLVPTSYAVVLRDYDFLVPGGLERCVRFLEAQPEYIAAHGTAAIVDVYSAGACGEVCGIAPYRQPSVEAEKAGDRLLDQLRSYTLPLFSVCRTDDLRGMYQRVSTLPDSFFAVELLPSCLAVVRGKVMELDCLYLARQLLDRGYLSPPAYDWLTSPNWLSSYQVFRDCLSEELALQDGISMDDAREIVNRALWSYLARRVTNESPERRPPKVFWLRSWARLAARRMPVLAWAWRKAHPFLPGGNHKIFFPAVLRPGSPHHSDFMPIYSAMTTRSNLLDGCPTPSVPFDVPTEDTARRNPQQIAGK